MNFTINVNVTGLEGLCSIFERLISGAPAVNAQAPAQAVTPAPVVQPQAQAVAPVQCQQQPQPQPQPVAAVPVMQAPVQQFAAPVAPAAPIPLATNPTFSQDQLAVAATQLMDAGRQNDVVGLLASFGVSSLRDLPVEQYGNFATQLRGLGARI